MYTLYLDVLCGNQGTIFMNQFYLLWWIPRIRLGSAGLHGRCFCQLSFLAGPHLSSNCALDFSVQDIQLARTHELKPYVIFIKPPNMSFMKQSRKNAKIITDYFVDVKFKVNQVEMLVLLSVMARWKDGQAGLRTCRRFRLCMTLSSGARQ